jgi:hypothetical protein
MRAPTDPTDETASPGSGKRLVTIPRQQGLSSMFAELVLLAATLLNAADVLDVLQ